LTLIGDGEEAGTWGQITNVNLQILNQLTSEAATIALAGTTHTLNVTDGTVEGEGQYAVLLFGGAPSGTNTVTISPPDAKRVFIVSNTSGQTVVLTQGSGGNVTIPATGTKIVYSDGGGASAAVVDLTAPFATLAGTETLTNKTLTSPTLTSPTLTTAPFVDGSYRGNIVAVSALDIDCSAGNYFTKTISANSTFTFSNVPASRSYGFTLELTVTSGTVTWPAAVKFPSNATPVLSTGKTHLFMFLTDDGGSRWRGAALTDYDN
jgi:hypothetical protein